jgi:hypothetical protein
LRISPKVYTISKFGFGEDLCGLERNLITMVFTKVLSVGGEAGGGGKQRYYCYEL